MSFTLYDAFVPTTRQLIGALPGVIAKARAHVAETGGNDADLIGARLAEDMWPLPWHVRSCWVHSSYALDQLRGTEFTPDFTQIPDSWDAMRAMIAEAEARLAEIRPGLLKSLEKEHITLFPKVYQRLKKLDMMPKTFRHLGKIMNQKEA